MNVALQSIILSVAVGALSGLLYGLSFLNSRKKAFLIYQTSVNKFHLNSTLISAIRILGLGALFYYTLKFKHINFLIVVLTFLISFWLTILKKEKII